MIPSSTAAELQQEEEEFEEENNHGWFATRKFGTMASTFSQRLRERIPSAGAAVRQTLDGIADAIATSAATIALEFNEMEREAREQVEKEDVQHERARQCRSDSGLKEYNMEEHKQQSMEHFVQCCNHASSKVPWEIWKNDATDQEQASVSKYGNSISGRFVEDQELKESIFALSLDEHTFTEPFLENDALVIENNIQFGADLDYDAQYCYFEQKKRITESQFLEENKCTVSRLLQIDPNLRKMYDELVGSVVNESVFWKNYFFHCERLRIKLENERSNDGNGPLDDNVVDVSTAKPVQADSPKKRSDVPPLIPRSASYKEHNFDDAVFVRKEDALPPALPRFVQKYPETLSNGSLVLIGNDDRDLDALANGLSK